MSTATRFNDEIVVQDYYRADGHSRVDYDWGSFDGFFASGRANGWGVQSIRRKTFPGGLPSDEVALYRGDWKNGKRDGYGRLEIPWEFKVYEGGWSQGKAFGFGKVITMKKGWAGEWEESGWKDGVRHGWGVKCITSDPKETMWQTGGYKDGEQHGYTVTSTDKTERYSSLKNGVPHGYQTIKRDGVLQSREFYLDGRLAAQPMGSFPSTWFPTLVAFSPLGARYNGPTHTVNGSVTLFDGDTYSGNLSYGTAHGYGVLVRSNTHLRSGTYDGGWKHGYACGYGVWMGNDGFVYAGGWLNGKPFGYGKVTIGSAVFDTFWEDGQGWKFEVTLNLAPPEPMFFRVPTPQPLPQAWAI